MERVEAYVPRELRRLALPGTAVPMLFWAVPLAPWIARDLERLKDRFTTTPGDAKDHGLLLLPTGFRGDGEASVSQVGALLEDLVPAENISPSAFRDHHKYPLLILSAAYPEPGWGVLFGVTEGSLQERFADVLRRVVGGIDSVELRKLQLAGAAHEQYIRTRHQRDEILRSASGGIAPQLFEELEAMREAVRETSWNKLPDLIRTFDSTYSSISSKRGEKGAPRLADSNVGRRVLAISRLLTGEKVDARRLQALGLEAAELDMAVRDPVEWAHKSTGLALQAFTHALEGLTSLLETATGASVREFDKQRRAAESANRAVDAQRVRYAPLLAEAIAAQTQLAPRFLVEFESVAREARCYARPVAWDPARMIGAKMALHDVRFTREDLRLGARRVARSRNSEMDLSSDDSSQTAGGIEFTDFVHYLHLRFPEEALRDLACHLVSAMLRPAEIEKVFLRTCQTRVGVEESVAVGAVFDALGWHAAAKRRARPLVSFVTDAGLTPGTHGADVRISAESLCKDVVLALAWDSPGGLDAVEDALRAAGTVRLEMDIRRDLEALTLGSAARWFEVLLRVEDRGEVGKSLVRVIDRANDLLKDFVHDKIGSESATTALLADGPGIVRELTDLSRRLVGPTAWHLTPTQRAGRAPVVLTGPAWSHTEGARHVLRVLVWDDERVGDEMRIANPSGLNPVIAQPRILDRLLSPRPQR